VRRTGAVVGAGLRIPAPVGGLEVLEDHPGVPVPIGAVAPDVEVPIGAAGSARFARRNQGCWSEVWLRTSSVITRIAPIMGLMQEGFELLHVPYVGLMLT